ncbi:MAG: hypothetical protein KC464_20330, partial [Myxococcales bacterium]|nr:hypothetical protein [Myxococcales bacterium]
AGSAAKAADKGAAADQGTPAGQAAPADKAAPADVKDTTAAPAAADKAAPPEALKAQPTVADDKQITMGGQPPAIGSTWEETKVQHMELNIDANGQKVAMTMDGVENKKTEALEVTNDILTKAKITYIKNDNTQTMGGKSRSKPTSVVGKTYTITAGSPLGVATDAGPAPDAEAAEVRDLEKHFGEPERMAKLLLGKTFPINQKVDLPADEIKGAMSDELTVKKLSLTYLGLDGTDATLDMDMEAEVNQGGNVITMGLAGKVRLDTKTSELVEMKLEGPVKMTGQASAEGTMRMEATRSR